MKPNTENARKVKIVQRIREARRENAQIETAPPVHLILDDITAFGARLEGYKDVTDERVVSLLASLKEQIATM